MTWPQSPKAPHGTLTRHISEKLYGSLLLSIHDLSLSHRPIAISNIVVLSLTSCTTHYLF